MSNQTFQPGDVVQLKSGGLKLIVTNPTIENDCITCCYYNEISGVLILDQKVPVFTLEYSEPDKKRNRSIDTQ